jgi:hypothetical protein
VVRGATGGGLLLGSAVVRIFATALTGSSLIMLTDLGGGGGVLLMNPLICVFAGVGEDVVPFSTGLVLLTMTSSAEICVSGPEYGARLMEEGDDALPSMGEGPRLLLGTSEALFPFSRLLFELESAAAGTGERALGIGDFILLLLSFETMFARLFDLLMKGEDDTIEFSLWLFTIIMGLSIEFWAISWLWLGVGLLVVFFWFTNKLLLLLADEVDFGDEVKIGLGLKGGLVCECRNALYAWFCEGLRMGEKTGGTLLLLELVVDVESSSCCCWLLLLLLLLVFLLLAAAFSPFVKLRDVGWLLLLRVGRIIPTCLIPLVVPLHFAVVVIEGLLSFGSATVTTTCCIVEGADDSWAMTVPLCVCDDGGGGASAESAAVEAEIVDELPEETEEEVVKFDLLSRSACPTTFRMPQFSWFFSKIRAVSRTMSCGGSSCSGEAKLLALDNWLSGSPPLPKSNWVGYDGLSAEDTLDPLLLLLVAR